MSVTLALANQKGGCGKTTSAIHLAASLAQVDYRVLLVDLDPQGHAGMGLGCTGEEGATGLSELLLRPDPPTGEEVAAAVLPARERLDLLASSISLAGFEPRAAAIGERQHRLRRLVEAARPSWDVVIIDCPPNLGLLTVNALLAAHLVVIPFEGSPFALQAVRRVEKTLDALEQATGHRPRGVLLPTMVAARDRFGADLRAELRRQEPGKILGQGIRRSVLFPRAAAMGKTVEELSPASGAAEDYRAASQLLIREWDRQLWRERAQFEGLQRDGELFFFTHPRLPPEQVSIAGDFNGWAPDAGVRLEPAADGGWRKVLALAPGRWEYKFVIRDEWRVDPGNPREVPNPQGTSNSLLELAGPGLAPAPSEPGAGAVLASPPAPRHRPEPASEADPSVRQEAAPPIGSPPRSAPLRPESVPGAAAAPKSASGPGSASRQRGPLAARALSIAAERRARAGERRAARLLVSRSHRYIRPSTR